MTSRVVDDIDDGAENKDPWPDPPKVAPRAWVNHTAEQWSAHTVAFAAKGLGAGDRVPALTVLSGLGQK